MGNASSGNFNSPHGAKVAAIDEVRFGLIDVEEEVRGLILALALIQRSMGDTELVDRDTSNPSPAQLMESIQRTARERTRKRAEKSA